jgi:acyl dehydratase
MPSAGLVHRVRAYNTAAESENAIHDDTVARRLGFRGGLVPGVEVWAYLAHLPAARWGRAWLEQGTMRAAFRRPVYDGAAVEARATIVAAADGEALDLVLADPSGEVCATGAATLPSRPLPPPDLAVVPCGTETSERPAASPETLAPGTALVPLTIGFHAAEAGRYLDDVREDLPLFRREGVAHPAWLLRTANFVLATNVRLGPWIHVASDARHFGVALDGDRITTRAVVVEEYERHGHRFVVLDVLVAANDARPLMRVRHTAIYRPRQTA